IILVDDEAEVRDSMAEGVNWEKLGFKVSGVARNGIEAWELIEEEAPDLVMTDIRMPYMDGLELTAKMREKYDDIKIIIFSGFDDFSYAKEAIKYKVENYIMKPINSRELEESMAEVKKRLDRERDSERNFAELKEKYDRSRPRILESVLHQVIRGQITDEVKQQLYDNHPKFLAEGSWIVAVAEMRHHDKRAEWEDIAYKAIDEELHEKYGAAIVIENRKVDIIFGNIDSEETIRICENLARNLKHQLNVDIVCGIGSKVDMLSDIRRSFNEACIALNKMTEERTAVYYVDIVADEKIQINSLSQNALKYIKENYRDPELSVETVADNIGFSHSYFSSVFKKEMGEACSNVINRIRMKEAARLLKETDYKTYVIAKDTGFADVAYFSYAFKRYYGVSPTKYRQR
ncbi:MAG: response regulator, partial [Lachnospiraceae bacterium]|nr:response regulator [Lachnospiraceae bacterium]